MTEYHLLAATRADLLRHADRPGEAVEAVEAYGDALQQATTDAERTFLRRRIQELTS